MQRLLAWFVIPGLVMGAGSAARAADRVAVDPQQTVMSPVDLVQIALNTPGKIKVGKKFRIIDEVESVGESSAAQSVSRYYLSKDDKVDATDIVLAGRRLPPVPAGMTNMDSTSVAIPPTVEPGPYYLIVEANASRTVVERTFENNVRANKVTVLPADGKKK